MSKMDSSHCNAVLPELMQGGHLCLVEESEDMKARKDGRSSKSRTQAASREILRRDNSEGRDVVHSPHPEGESIKGKDSHEARMFQ